MVKVAISALLPFLVPSAIGFINDRADKQPGLDVFDDTDSISDAAPKPSAKRAAVQMIQV